MSRRARLDGVGLLAHVCGFSRHVRGLLDGRTSAADPPPPIDRAAAARDRDGDLAGLVAALRAVPPDVPAANWPIAPDTAASWTRRTAHELAVHRRAPIPFDVARDGIAEFFEVFAGHGAHRHR